MSSGIIKPPAETAVFPPGSVHFSDDKDITAGIMRSNSSGMRGSAEPDYDYVSFIIPFCIRVKALGRSRGYRTDCESRSNRSFEELTFGDIHVKYSKD